MHNSFLDKHAEPTVNGGISNSLRYKWLDLNFLFSINLEDILMIIGHKRQNMVVNDSYANIPTYYRDSWKKPGDQTNINYLLGKSSSVSMNKITSSRRITVLIISA